MILHFRENRLPQPSSCRCAENRRRLAPHHQGPVRGPRLLLRRVRRQGLPPLLQAAGEGQGHRAQMSLGACPGALQEDRRWIPRHHRRTVRGQGKLLGQVLCQLQMVLRATTVNHYFYHHQNYTLIAIYFYFHLYYDWFHLKVKDRNRNISF